ncbi:MAG: fasciclin domain-containing protein [Phycisphaerales bacterium]
MTRKTTALTIAAVAGLATAAMALTGTSTTTNKDKDGCQSACTMSTQAACGWGDKDGEATAVTMVSLDDHAQMGNRGNGADGTIVQVASEAGQFETLLAAAKAAGLAEALSSSGPLTVFAPTDEAFAKLGQGTINDLLKPENKQKLVSILTYHVVSGELPADKVLSRNDATTLNGQRIDFSQNNRGAFVDGARIIATDVAASNGVIHVIDSVIMPESKNLAQIATGDGRFSILAKAVEAAGLTGALTGDDALTVFAPTDAAFNKLPQGTLEELLRPENRDTLRQILTYHVVPGRVYARDAVGAQRAQTLQGDAVRVGISDGRLTIDGAGVVNSDIEASNGVIHVIDSVILPN